VDLPAVPGEEAGALLHGTIAERDPEWHLAAVRFDGGALWIADASLTIGQHVRVRILARDVSLALQPPERTSIQNVLPGTVRAIAAGGHPSQALVQVACGGTLLLARITTRSVHALGLAAGSAVWVQVKSAALVA
jgi:molybdate transport system ATP-binding protein